MAIKISRTFLMRKLHQITGIVPLGTFFFVHLFTNSKSMSGEQEFNNAVGDIHHIPYLLFVEIGGIFLPLLFHSIYGVFISAEARNNVFNYGYGRNWFYVFQRVTGIFLFFFLLFHLANLRFGLIPGLESYGNPVAGNADRAFAIVASEFKNIWILIFYILGVIATAWHLAYGFFLFAVDWGIVIGEKAQRYTLYGSVGLSILLSVVGINAAVAFIEPCGLFPRAFCEQVEKNEIVKPQKF
ncbi:MAG: succinate dehydrogenase [Acidobacteriota bacterium]|jgi:succinate dehydrogenase / fumarate reductase cytochrome b subunit|nr:succinate dehydrogenase [Acidobacteriota bacterium]MDQ3372712.1 succinate dehydrogenase [Acidobacteriota bacterium]